MASGGTPASVADEVGRTLDRMKKALDTSRKAALREVGKKSRAEMRSAATRVPGGDRRFSNMRGYSHGGLLDVTFSVRDDLVFIGSKGPWKIAEEGAAPHGHHPGTARTQGRQSWTSAADPLVAAAETEFPRTIENAVEEAFDD